MSVFGDVCQFYFLMAYFLSGGCQIDVVLSVLTFCDLKQKQCNVEI